MLGLGVERLALMELLLYERDDLLGCLVEQQRAYGLAHLQMLHEHIGGTLEIDRLSLLVDIVHIVEEARRASATTQHDILKLSHFVEHVALYFAEAVLAALVKELLDGLAHTAFYVPVEVIEGQAQVFGEGLADRCLS